MNRKKLLTVCISVWCITITLSAAPMMDSRVRKVPVDITERIFIDPEETLPKLVSFLVSGTSDIRGRVKVLHDWICDNIAYDVAVFDNPDVAKDQKYEAVLRRKKGVCAGYANLFQEMCRMAGVECIIIGGWSKGEGYPGYLKPETDHAWNAVRIDGKWLLVDVTWDAGSVSSKHRFEKEYLTEWFMCSPSVFIWSHLPEDDKYQFLAKPRTHAEFEDEPYVRPSFFANGLSFTKYRPSYTSYIAGLTYYEFNLSKTDNIVAAQIVNSKGQLVSDILWMQRMGNTVSLWVDLPDTQYYRLLIYAGRSSEYKLLNHLPVVTYNGNFEKKIDKCLEDGSLTEEDIQCFKDAYLTNEYDGLYYLVDDMFNTERNNTLLKVYKAVGYAYIEEVLAFDLYTESGYSGFGDVGQRFPIRADHFERLKNTKLISPLDGILEQNVAQKFEIATKDYGYCEIVCGEEHIPLKKNKKSGKFECSLTIPECETIEVRCSDDGKKFSTLWTYKTADRNVYAPLDVSRRIRNVPKSITDLLAADSSSDRTDGIYDLTKFLIDGVDDERTMCKLIHDWICDNIAYDVDYYNDYSIAYKQAFYDVVKSRRAISSGYASLFDIMCKIAGIRCIQVSGWWKKDVSRYEKLPKGPTHIWNIVYIDGQMYMVDVEKDAGYVDEDNNHHIFIKLYSQEWFLQSPVEFIYSHLPCEDKYQLLKNPISGEKFFQMPFVPCRFYDYGFDFIDVYPNATVELDGKSSFDLSLSNEDTEFSFQLVDNRMNSIDDAVSYTKIGNKIRVTYDIPDGDKSYWLMLYAGDRKHTRIYDWIPKWRFDKMSASVKQLLSMGKITQKEYDYFVSSYFFAKEHDSYYLREDRFDIPRNAALRKICRLAKPRYNLIEIFRFKVKAAEGYKGYAKGK